MSTNLPTPKSPRTSDMRVSKRATRNTTFVARAVAAGFSSDQADFLAAALLPFLGIDALEDTLLDETP